MKHLHQPVVVEADFGSHAEKLRRFRAIHRLHREPSEENLWNCIIAFQGYTFKTYSGLPFSYHLKIGKQGSYTKELWIDRRENSKSLVWSSVRRIYENLISGKAEMPVQRPKALGDIRGVTYIYGILYCFGLIEVPEERKEPMHSEACHMWKTLIFRKLLLFLLVFAAVFAVPRSVYAKETSSREVVRVGFFAMDSYHIMNEDGERSGYGYDFLRMIAKYLDIDYEYVGYEDSWDEMQQMLEDGEIDMLTSAQKTPEREALFAFSKPIGDSRAIVTVKNNNRSIVAHDYDTYDGMVIGMLEGNSRNDDFEKLAQDKGFSYCPVYFSMSTELAEALQKGQIDAAVTSSLRQTEKERIIENFAVSDFYVMVRKEDTDLLDKINYAIDQLNAVEGDWKNGLNNKYYTHSEYKNLEFTDAEKAIIQQYASGERLLTISCGIDRKPYSYVENGELCGIIPDYFKRLAAYIGIPYKILIPSSREEISKWHDEGTADIFIDARITSEKWIEDNHCAVTVPYMDMRLAMVTRRDCDGNIEKIAVAENQGLAGIEDGLVRDAERVFVSTREAGMQAVLDGEVDAAFVYLYTAQEFVNRDKRGLMTYTILEEPAYEYCMVVTDRVTHEMAGILSKGIYAMPSGTIEDIAFQYTNYKAGNVDFMTWIRIYPVISIAVFAVFSLMCIFAVLLYERQRAIRIEQHRSEELRKLAAQAEAANRAKSDFLANMSHDIRTPMNAIVGIASLMECESGLSDKMRAYIQKMQLSSRHLLSLIDDVLDMSKIEANEISLNLEKISLASQVEQVDTIIRPQANAHEQQFRIHIHEIAHEYLVGDGVRLRQIFLNLLSNAVRYTPNGGMIDFDISEISCEDSKQAKFVFSVTDTGYGMTQEFLKHIYEPFVRSEASVTNKIQGTGLGMPITKSIVDLMGGEIQIESEPKKGSRFTVTLTFPIDADAECQLAADRVLLISSDEMLRRNVTIGFGGVSAELCLAETEEEAERLLQTEAVDVILVSDSLENPVLPDVVKRLRSFGKQDMLILCLEDIPREQELELVTKVGIDGLIFRPFFLSVLNRAIEKQHSSKTLETRQVSELSGMKFLCAEDNSLNAEILKALLEVHGSSGVIYADGAELVKAFENVKSGDYDAILMDIQMPNMNGLEAAAAIRGGANPLGREIPIIAMTANAFSDDVRHCMEAGMDAHIPKPIDVLLLEKTVARLIESRG